MNILDLIKNNELKIVSKETNTSGIYVIFNKIKERLYVGSAVNIKRRIDKHFRLLNQNIHDNQYLQNDFNLSKDFQAFTLEEVLDKKILLSTEQKYLDKYFDKQNKCYNICSIAGAAMSERNHTPESKIKIIEGHLENPEALKYKNHEWLHQKYVVERLSSVKIGSSIGVHFQTICRWMKELEIPIRKKYDFIRTEDQKQKVSQSVKKSKKQYCIPIRATKLDNNKQIFFESLSEASKQLNVSVGNISKVIHKQQGRTQANGYQFEYLSEKRD